MTKPKSRATDLERFIRILSQLPERHYLKLQVERSESDEELYLGGCIIEEPPEDGWPSRATYFGYVSSGPDEPATPYERNDSARGSVTTDLKNHRAFARLLTGMLRDYVKKVTSPKPGS